MEDLYKQWSDAFDSVGMCHLSLDTCCKILAVVYVYGGSHENFTFNEKLRIDYQAAAKRCNIGGGLTPNIEAVKLIRQYTQELEKDVEKSEIGEREGAIFSKVCHVDWANKLFKERYGFNTLLI